MYDDAICYHAVGAFTPWTTCTSSSGAPFVVTAKADPVIPAGGSCDAVNEHVFTPPVWTTSAKLCVGTPQDDCHAEYCDANIDDDTGTNGYAKRCIFRPSVFSCPDERYTERTIIYRDLSDTRNCSDCSCGDPTGATCSATMELWTEPDCTGELAQIPSDQSCTATGLSSNTKSYRLQISGPNDGECSPNGGEPGGTVEPIEPMTVCCEPG